MQHTIVAVFENYPQAERAIDDLVAAGFPREDARLNRNQDQTGGNADAAGAHDDDSMMHGIRNFFNDIFGVSGNRDDVDLYSEAVLRGNFVVSLSVDDDDLVDRATEILDRYDPIDIDDQASQWQGGAWRGAGQSAMGSGAGAQQTGTSGSAGGTGSGANLQSERSDSAVYSPQDMAAGQASRQGEPVQGALRQDNLQSGVQQNSSLQQDSSQSGEQQFGGLQSDAAQSSGLQSGALQSGSQQSSGLQSSTPQKSALLSSRPQTDALQSGAQLGSQQRADMDETAIPVIQEELKVGKRAVQRGGVRVFQRLVETPVQENIDLRDERVTVERRPVDQPVSAAELSAFQEGSFEVRETAEEPVVEKVARVVEEVVVGKEVVQRQEQISDTVRSTEVEIEQLRGGSSSSTGLNAGTGADLGGTGAAESDDYFRQHWNSNYSDLGGSYDEYAPAYRYGATSAGSERYRGRSWADVEPEMRSSWEAENSGSAWEKMKNAVRHGWERITS